MLIPHYLVMVYENNISLLIFTRRAFEQRVRKFYLNLLESSNVV